MVEKWVERICLASWLFFVIWFYQGIVWNVLSLGLASLISGFKNCGEEKTLIFWRHQHDLRLKTGERKWEAYCRHAKQNCDEYLDGDACLDGNRVSPDVLKLHERISCLRPTCHLLFRAASTTASQMGISSHPVAVNPCFWFLAHIGRWHWEP